MVVGSQFVFFFCIFVLSLWVSIVVAPMKLVCCSIAINAGIVLGCFSTDRAKAKHSIYHLIYIQTVTSGHGEKKKLWLQVAGESSICWLSSALQMELWRELSRVTAAFSWRGRAVFDILGWECTLQKFQASLIFFFLLRRKQSLVFVWQDGEYAAVLDLVFLSVFSLYVISYWVHDVEIRAVGAQTICSSCSSCGICQFVVTLDVCYSAE